MEDVKTIKVKRINDEVKTIKVKRVEDDVKTIKVKRVEDDVKYVEVLNLNRYYVQNMSRLNALPDTFIKNYNSRIELAYYYAKASCLSIDERVNKIYETFKDVDLNAYIKFYDDEVSSRLKAAGIYNEMSDGVYKIYHIHHFVSIQNGYDKIPNMNYSIKELREILLWKATIDMKSTNIKLQRMFAIKNGNIVESTDNENIKKHKLLKGGSVMIECGNCIFVNIPYYYYKKLLKIESVYIGYDVVDMAIPIEYYINDRLVTTENLECYSIESMCSFALHYINTLKSLNLLSQDGAEHLYDYKNDKTTIQYKNGKSITTNIRDFMTEYFDFLY